MNVSIETILVLLTCAAQIGALVRFMAKWEARMVKLETLMGILAGKNGLHVTGNGVETP